MQILKTRKQMQAFTDDAHNKGQTIGFVPTMGALHDGHLSLVSLAHEQSDLVIASIFVNPTQFTEGEDFETYPRANESDIEKLKAHHCDALYLPDGKEIYPEGDATHIQMSGPALGLDSDHRPHFFHGVATVVLRLFLHVKPDIAIFGEKDYQQLLVIKRMVADLGLEIDIMGAPLIREKDGLAMSSRNAYLSTGDRRKAASLYQALKRVEAEIRSGQAIDLALEEGKDYLTQNGFETIDYLSARNGANLMPFKGDERPEHIRLLAAAWMGETRLIDNIRVGDD